MKRIFSTTSVLTLLATPAFAWIPPPVNGNGNAVVTDGGQAQTSVGVGISRVTTGIQVTNDPKIFVSLPPSTPAAKPANTDPAPKTAKVADPAPVAPRRVASSQGSFATRQQAVFPTIPNIPPATAYAPSFNTADPCTGKSASAALQSQVFGLSFGGTQMDYGCAAERTGNQETLGQQLDFAVMCREDSNYRKAAADIGHPCPVDDPKSASYQPPSHGWFYSAPQAQPVAYAPPAPAPVQPVPAWCAAALKNSHPTPASAVYIQQECVR